jgi:hypothetical protein
MKKSFFLLIAIVFIFKCAQGQNPPIEWGVVPKVQLEMKEYGLNPKTHAVILCDYGKIYFDIYKYELRSFYERHVRIKILTEEGLKYAKIEIPYMGKEEYEKILGLKAETINQNEKGEPVITKMITKDAMIERTDDRWRKLKFTLPDVKVGSVIEYAYKMVSLDFVKFDDWYFQNSIPTLWSELRLKMPETFNYLLFVQREDLLCSNDKNIIYQKLGYTNVPYWDINYDMSGGYTNSVQIELTTNQRRLAMKDLPGYETQPFSKDPDAGRAKVTMHLQEAQVFNFRVAVTTNRWEKMTRSLFLTTLNDYFSMSRRQWQSVSNAIPYYIYRFPESWEVLNKRLLKDDAFSLKLIKHWKYENLLDSITINSGEPKQRMIAIYDYVRKNIHWDGNYSVIPLKKVADIYKTKKGSSSEVNFLLIYLLQHAGLQADPIITSTCSNGPVRKEYPTTKMLNQCIASVRCEGQTYLLDATDPLRPFNYLDKNDMNESGWRVSKLNPGWIEILPPSASNESETVNLTMNNAEITGNVDISSEGYFGLEKRTIIAKTGKEVHQYNLKKDLSDWKINNFTISNEKEIDQPLKVSLQISMVINSKVDSLILKPSLTNVLIKNELKDQFRESPVWFGNTIEKNFSYTLKLDKNYTVVHIPQTVRFHVLNNLGTFDYKATLNENILNYSAILKINKAEFFLEEYSDLKQFFEIIENKLSEVIVLKAK